MDINDLMMTHEDRGAVAGEEQATQARTITRSLDADERQQLVSLAQGVTCDYPRCTAPAVRLLRQHRYRAAVCCAIHAQSLRIDRSIRKMKDERAQAKAS